MLEGEENVASARPRTDSDVPDILPGIHPHTQHEQKALQHILAEVCQLAHDVVGQALGKGRMAQTAQAQLVARLLWEQDAAGSSPVTSTKNPLKPSVSEDFYHSHVIYVCS